MESFAAGSLILFSKGKNTQRLTFFIDKNRLSFYDQKDLFILSQKNIEGRR